MEKNETYAIVRQDGKQWVVSPGSTLYIDRTEAEPGTDFTISNVLFYKSGDKILIGRPLVNDAVVTCTVVKHLRGKKIIVFKKKRRKNYKKTIGHRQNYTELRVKEISLKAG